jgi:hypothetical protein
MSFVSAVPESLAAASANVAGIGSSIRAATVAAAAHTTTVATAAPANRPANPSSAPDE